MSKLIAAYGGGFKPPTKGHFEVVERALNDFPEIDEFIIYVGGGERDGINQTQSILIWEIYQTYLPMKVKIEPSKAPIGDIIRLGKNNLQDEVYFVIGARDGFEDDMKDIESRTKNIEEKYPNMKIKVVTTPDKGMSGTNARQAAKVSYEDFIKFIPNELSDSEKEEVYNIVKPSIKEGLNENASYGKDIDVKGKIMQLTQHMLDKGYNIEPLPTVEFVDGDSDNARDFLGKTAYYNPENQTITLFTEGRHPKDIVRSFSHEMIHHIQYLEDRLGDITTTNTQEDDNLNNIEAEANLKGTMTFRNWTDSLNEGKKSKDPFGLNQYARELALGLEESLQPTYTMYSGITGEAWEKIWKNKNFIDKVTNVTNDEDFALDYSYNFKTGKYEDRYVEISNIPLNAFVSVRDRDYEDDDDFESIEGLDSEKKINAIKYNDLFLVNLFPYKSQIKTKLVDNSLNETIVGDKIECDNCDWSWDISSGGDDLYTCHKCWHDNTPIEEKKNKDPFGLNAYARELAMGLEENEKVMDYKIYCDMDGVLADFESGYEELTGVDLKGEFKKGDDFWDPIKVAGVGFWAGLKWMPDGQKLWDYLKPFNPVLLSAPSREQSSRIGKHVWVKYKIPGTKLILRYAKQKQELATPESILIDDRQVNIDQWEAAGGIGILHTSTANTIQQLQKLGL